MKCKKSPSCKNEAAEGRTWCASHLEQKRGYYRKKSEDEKEHRIRCSSKGCPRPVAVGRKTCNYHLEYQRQVRRRRLEQEGPDWWKKDEATRLRTLRERMHDALGGKCQECGETDRRVFEVHHINGDGAEHRREKPRGTRTYAWYLSDPARLERLLLLCANCHRRLHATGLGWDD